MRRRSFLFLIGLETSKILTSCFSLADKTRIKGQNSSFFSKQNWQGASFYQITIDLNQPDILLTIGLAHNAPKANSSRFTSGDEPFEKFVGRYQAAESR